MKQFRVTYYFKKTKSEIEIIDTKCIIHPEIVGKSLKNSSLTYWKLKSMDVKNDNKLLTFSKFCRYTAY